MIIVFAAPSVMFETARLNRAKPERTLPCYAAPGQHLWFGCLPNFDCLGNSGADWFVATVRACLHVA